MSGFMQWLGMGGYSMYVWPAYAVVCGVLILNLVAIKLQRKSIHKKLKRWFHQ